jgi:FixJ family two-component response regulator
MNTSDTPTVFIIDDDPRMRASMQRLMKSIGLDTKSFATPQDFLQYKLPKGPNCLVLDVRLPGKSGLDVQQELNERGIDVLIIFITGRARVTSSVTVFFADLSEDVRSNCDLPMPWR